MEKHNSSATISCVFEGFLLFSLIGGFTSGANRLFPPYGYLIRFVLYAGLVYFMIRRLCGKNGLTLSDCRIPRLRLSLRGILVAILLPLTFLFLRTRAEGHWVMNSMSSRQTMATVFYLLFGTGFCSGITEEMMFRGYMTKISERHWGKISAIIAPTLLFTLGHYRAGMDILTFLKQSLFMISFSILLTIVTYQSGQIWDAALIHAIWDIFAVSNGVYSVDYGMSPNTFFTYVLERGTVHALSYLTQMQGVLLAIIIYWIFIASLLLAAKLQGRGMLGDDPAQEMPIVTEKQ